MQKSALTAFAAILLAGTTLPSFAQDAMSSSNAMAPDAMAPSAMSTDAMGASSMTPDAMSTNAMSTDAMAPAAPMSDEMTTASDAMQSGDPMLTKGRTIQITFEDLTTGQPFSPSFFESRSKDAPALFKLGDKASDALVAVAEGGNIGMFSVGAAMNKDSLLGDAQLAIHTLPGQKRTIIIHVDKDHPIIDGVWMLGNTNDGFSGFADLDAYALKKATTLDVIGYDAGSENNNEKKGFLGALGGGNERDPENGVITKHTGIRGDADAPKAWNWDESKPVAHITITPLN